MPPRLRALQLSFVLAGLWALLTAVGALEPLERLTMQARYWLRPAPGFTAPIVVIGIDEAALARYGQMPWDRRRFATLLDRLRSANAAVVGIDVAFNEPSGSLQADAALAAAMRRMPTVLPTFLAYVGAGSTALQAVEPLPALADAAIGLGSVQLSRQQQSQLWELEPDQAFGDRVYPAFSTAVAAAYRPGLAFTPQGPWWRHEPLLIHFRGPATSVPTMSAVDALEKPLPDMRGRIVLVGAMANGLPDTNFAVPDMRGGPMAGVEVFAHALDNMVQDGFLRRLSLPAFFVLACLLALWPGRLLVGGAVARRVALGAGAGALWASLALALFWVGIWLEVVPVLGFFASATVLGMARERSQLLEGRARLLERYALDLASEAQRQRARVEGELHDGVQQLMMAIIRELRGARKHLAVAERVERRIDRAESLADEACSEIMRLRQDLMPPALRRDGLTTALQVLAHEVSARGGMQVSVLESGWEALAASEEVELYWLVKEALNNAEKHAGAATVVISLRRSPAGADIEVADDGCGFTPRDLSVAPEGPEHSGLHRMWLRMHGRGGALACDSHVGGGTRLRFSLPGHASVPLDASIERNLKP